MFGDVYSWDGSSRAACFPDLDSKFGQMSDSTLLKHLSTLSSSSTDDTKGISTMARTLLRPPLINIEGADIHTMLLDLSSALASSLSQKRSATANINHLEDRVSSLRGKLALRRNGPKEEVTSSNDGAIDDVEVVDEISLIGLTKDLSRCMERLNLAREEHASSQLNIERLTSKLAANDMMRDSDYDGTVVNTVGYLHQRQMGLVCGPVSVDYGCPSQLFGNCGNYSTNISASSGSLIDDITLKYKMLWSINAHCLNPAYCVIFDKTGEYAITGADDFLVKIW